MTTTVQKEYFRPGDLVKVKHLGENSPVMFIVKKVTDESKDKMSLQGMECAWFNNNLDLCKEIFSTKDLILIKRG